MEKFMGTFVPGFEKIVVSELKKQISSIKNVTENRGKVFFDIEKKEIEKILKVGFIDNFYYFISTFKLGGGQRSLSITRKEY